MKKIITIISALTIILTFVSCNKSDNNATNGVNNSLTSKIQDNSEKTNYAYV